MTPEEASGLADKYVFALIGAGKIPAPSVEEAKESVASVALAYKTLMGYMLPLPSPAPIAKTPAAGKPPKGAGAGPGPPDQPERSPVPPELEAAEAADGDDVV